MLVLACGTSADRKEPVRIDANGLRIGLTHVAMDASGGGMALWVERDVGVNLVAARYEPETGWAEPEVVASGVAPLDSIPGSALAVSPHGDALVGWAVTSELAIATHTTGGWSAPVVATNAVVRAPVAASDDSGRSFVVWNAGGLAEGGWYTADEGWLGANPLPAGRTNRPEEVPSVALTEGPRSSHSATER